MAISISRDKSSPPLQQEQCGLRKHLCDRNPGAPNKGELVEVKEGAPSIYVGETSRTMQERALEHLGAARRGEDDSHMHKHQILEYEGGPGNFIKLS